MIKDGLGGANTRTGLVFEGKTDLATFLNSQQSYKVNNQNEVFYNDDLVGQIFKKHSFYKFLESRNIKWQDYISKRLLPDDSIYVIINNTFFEPSSSIYFIVFPIASNKAVQPLV